MGKREDERAAQHQAWCRHVEKLGWAKTDEFEKDLNAPNTDYRLGTYSIIMHRTIMHYARKGMLRDDYDHRGDYALSPAHMDKAVDLIGRQTKLALAANKIEMEIAKLDRQVMADGHKRRLAEKSRKFWDQPHASHSEPDKHRSSVAQTLEGPGADVRVPALQGPDEDGRALP
jgi:hypothetical protein